ncbi:MAG: fructose-bisphosphatase class III, partial [Lachnospiraceae bacterium]|nr:fructose-bisphosphatase class III [Lachnospiraceae bacterium]
SHGMRLVAHEPFESMEAAISRESDIFSDSTSVEIAPVRIRVADTDSGTDLKDRIIQLERLLRAYRDGTIVEK